jgi:hypothetical protein
MIKNRMHTREGVAQMMTLPSVSSRLVRVFIEKYFIHQWWQPRNWEDRFSTRWASLAQYGAGSNNKDGGTGTYTTPSADPKADAMKSSVAVKRGMIMPKQIVKKKIMSMGLVKEE